MAQPAKSLIDEAERCVGGESFVCVSGGLLGQAALHALSVIILAGNCLLSTQSPASRQPPAGFRCVWHPADSHLHPLAHLPALPSPSPLGLSPRPTHRLAREAASAREKAMEYERRISALRHDRLMEEAARKEAEAARLKAEVGELAKEVSGGGGLGDGRAGGLFRDAAPLNLLLWRSALQPALRAGFLGMGGLQRWQS